ncbi:glycosyltransferase involved in cell wall biosynthesis [Buttiauxella sp. BIGb0471]|uniref:glycosyltransferase n=1 Tax=Buttiauxella sp. BIGb0471 TaxID=2940597 RepID=UPI0021688464|nr:glycosyltransferase [Buttiauxella sp. BIGb0471]MCS3601276.1 glycosyltransferase involved in cell wall biosynthesis [Buttiauxella sp. BIGb0471]
MDIEIALSVLNSGINNVKFRSDFKYLVIHQISDGVDYSDMARSMPENVRYISSHDVGLSRSRNLAIKYAQSDYIWIMDDDVSIKDDAKQYIQKLAEKYSDTPLLVVSHTLTNENENENEKIKVLNIVSATCICSIDMIIKVSKIRGLLFDTNFGLGARYPSGEEYIFACKLINSGQKLIKSNKICSYHPDITNVNNGYPDKDSLTTKKNMFLTANGSFVGHLLYIAFLFKSLFK